MGGLRRDPAFVLAGVVIGGLALASFVLPAPHDLVDTLTWWGDFLLLGVTIVSAWRAFRADRTVGGRRFWATLTVGLCLWFAVLVLWEVVGDKNPVSEVAADYLFLAYYFGLFLATAVKPHERREVPTLSPIEITETAAGLVLAFGLLAYFVVLPRRVSPESYATYVPSLALYVILDVLLVTRVVGWCQSTRGSRWRPVYFALAFAFLATAFHDTHELAVYLSRHTLDSGAWDIVWWTQFLGLIGAASLARQQAEQGLEDPDDRLSVGLGRQAVIGPVASFAFVLPVVHLGGQVSGLLDPVLGPLRDTLVLGCALILGALAILHHELIDRRYRQMREDLHAAQMLLQQSRKMEALGRMAGGIAHEFNNLLSVIIGYSDMLADRFGTADSSSDSVQQIKIAAERAAVLTRQLATFSRGQMGTEVLIEVDRALDTLGPTVRRLLGDLNSLTIIPGAVGAWIEVDRDQFDRAVLNLVANARDAMPDGGMVRIETRLVFVTEDDSRDVGSLPPGPYLELSVTDTGIGMDEEVRSRLFEPFFTTKASANHRGLGLAIVYGFVRQASGHITVDSSPGRGSTVRLFFPRSEAPTATREHVEPVRADDRPFTVLLAEDERGLRRLIKASFEREGFIVLDAADGRAAVDLAQQHQGTIDLFVSDVAMPGFTGPEAARRVLADRPELRVLFISGYAPETLGDLHVAGTESALLAKPFTMNELVSRAHRMLGSERPATVATASESPQGSEATT